MEKVDMLTMPGFCAVFDGYIKSGYTSVKAYELTEIRFQEQHNTETNKYSSFESFKVSRAKYFKRNGRI